MYSDDNLINGHEGSERFCNIQDAGLELQDSDGVDNGGVAMTCQCDLGFES